MTPTSGALASVRRVLRASDSAFTDVAGFIHGTTLATNALIERRGAVVASICTQGFRDILEIAYERRYSQYDINLEKPNLIVPRSRSFTVPERMSATGDVLRAIDERSIDTLVAQLDAAGVQAVAVCLLHAYANPAHEQRLRTLLAARRPDLTISLSSEVSPEAREFERLCSTVANAYIQPLVSGYLENFRTRFAAEGLACPILMMTASGGNDDARKRPRSIPFACWSLGLLAVQFSPPRSLREPAASECFPLTWAVRPPSFVLSTIAVRKRRASSRSRVPNDLSRAAVCPCVYRSSR